MTAVHSDTTWLTFLIRSHRLLHCEETGVRETTSPIPLTQPSGNRRPPAGISIQGLSCSSAGAGQNQGLLDGQAGTSDASRVLQSELAGRELASPSGRPRSGSGLCIYCLSLQRWICGESWSRSTGVSVRRNHRAPIWCRSNSLRILTDRCPAKDYRFL